MLERLFRPREHHTVVRTGVEAGFSTVLKTACFLAVNPLGYRRAAP